MLVTMMIYGGRWYLYNLKVMKQKRRRKGGREEGGVLRR